jgi:hypothetical protein
MPTSGLSPINRALNSVPKRAEARQAEQLRDTVFGCEASVGRSISTPTPSSSCSRRIELCAISRSTAWRLAVRFFHGSLLGFESRAWPSWGSALGQTTSYRTEQVARSRPRSALNPRFLGPEVRSRAKARRNTSMRASGDPTVNSALILPLRVCHLLSFRVIKRCQDCLLFVGFYSDVLDFGASLTRTTEPKVGSSNLSGRAENSPAKTPLSMTKWWKTSVALMCGQPWRATVRIPVLNAEPAHS